MKLWPTLGVAFLLITSMRLSWSLGRENARNEAQASTLKSTVDTLNIISAGVQDMQQVLAQLRAENQQRNQDGEVRREQLRNDIAKMNAPTLCLTLVLLTGCAGTQNAPGPAPSVRLIPQTLTMPVTPPPSLTHPHGETSEYGATAFWMHWKPVTRINGPLLNWIRE
ncbi:Rz1-like lysis system protein LysC [Escherichia coli]